MPTTKTKTQQSIKPVPSTAATTSSQHTRASSTRSERYAAFVEASRKSMDDTLESLMEDFLKDGLAEEKHFMTEVLQLRESSNVYDGVKSFGSHEIPLFSAIQYHLDGMYLVPVKSEAMVAEVEKFITEKIASGWKAPKKDYRIGHTDPEEIKQRLSGLLARQVQLFSLRCKQTDLIFMIDLLEQWESLTDNTEFWQKTEYPLAAAAELHLDVMKRR